MLHPATVTKLLIFSKAE